MADAPGVVVSTPQRQFVFLMRRSAKWRELVGEIGGSKGVGVFGVVFRGF